LKRPQRQAVHRLQGQQHLDDPVAVRLRTPALAGGFKRRCEHRFIHPDAHITALNQARVVLGPVLDSVDPIGLAGLAVVFSHVQDKGRQPISKAALQWRGDLCNNAKRVTRPMLNFKSFRAARNVLAGIELMHMIRKGQLLVEGGIELSFADQFYALAGKIRPV